MTTKPPFRSSRGRIASALVAVLITCSVVLIFLHKTSSDLGIRLVNRQPGFTEQVKRLPYLKSWLQYNSQHSFEYDDRLAFAEMAFRTSSYAAMIRDANKYDEASLVTAEENLYPWIQGLDALRNAHIQRDAQSDSLIHQMRSMGRTPAAQAEAASRGIVIAAGNRQLKYTTQLIATIRNGLKSRLPIEVYYYGREDLSRQKQDFLSSTFDNVRTIDLSQQQVFNESFVNLAEGTWALKPYAIMLTSFTEVMLLDADSVLLADPDDFFLEPGYKATGTLFFHDRLVRNWHSDTLHLFLREQLGERPPSRSLNDSVFWREGLSHRQESGLVVLNKADPNVFASLIFIVWQNAGKVRDRITYNVFYGDKESFWVPFELAGLPYHFSRYWAGAIGPEQATHSDGFCSDHILHFFEAPYAHDASKSDQDSSKRGRPAWFNGALRKNKLWDPDESVMDISKSIWTMDGSWVWRPLPDLGGSTCCMVDYTRWSMADLNLGRLLPEIFHAGAKALKLVEEFDDEA